MSAWWDEAPMEEGRVVLEYCNDTVSGAAVFGTEEWGGFKANDDAVESD